MVAFCAQGFHKIFGGGDLLRGRFFSLCRGQSQMEDLMSGLESDEEDFKKIVC